MNFKLVTIAALFGLTYAAQLHAQHQDTDTPAVASWGFLSDGDEGEDYPAVELEHPLPSIRDKITGLLKGKNTCVSSQNNSLREQVNFLRKAFEALQIN